MLYLGIDVGKTHSKFYVADATGARVTKGTVSSSALECANLIRELSEFCGTQVKVAMETGNATFTMARAMQEAGAEVTVIHARDNALIAQSKKKTDGIDAKTLAEQLRRNWLPAVTVRIPSAIVEQLRHLVSARRALVEDRTSLTNRLRATLARYGHFPKARTFMTDRAWLAVKTLLPELGFGDQITARQLVKLGLELNKSIRVLARAISRHIQKHFAEEHALLQSIPGLGPVSISSLIAFAGNVDDFRTARQYASYAGLTPSTRQSGKTTTTGGTSRTGNRFIGGNLVQAGLGFINSKAHHEDELYLWYDKVRRKRGWRKARVALARKLASIAYGVLKHRQPYNPDYIRETLAT